MPRPKTPPEIVTRVAAELGRFMALPATREAFAKLGHETGSGGPDVVRQRIVNEQKAFAPRCARRRVEQCQVSTTHRRRRAARRTHLLQALVDYGVEHLFCNLGTDHAPLIEEMARWRTEGRPLPNIVLCPHENVAVHMAGGYAAATGRGQAVLVHVDAGTANSAMALHNLFRARIPVLLMAGRAPATTFNGVEGGRDTYVHFVQEPFDQGSVVRPYVKWEYTLPWPSTAGEVIARAHSVMHSDPPGPVYLMLPREALAAPLPAE